jgi:hypothetical protein
MNLYDPTEHYQLANELVNYLEQWPQLNAAQRKRAVNIGVAMQAFQDAGACHWSDTLPNGERDMRGFDLIFRYRLLERHPDTAGHATRSRAELATLVQRQREAMKH